MKLLFDCDGTILDSMHVWIDVETYFFKKYNHEPTREEMKLIASMDYKSVCKWLSQNIALDMTYQEVVDHYESTVNKAYGEEIQGKAGALETLKALHDQGIQMAVASSTDINLLEMAFDRLGISHYFDFIITSNNSPYKKSEKEYWELACSWLGEIPANVILYDDALYAIKVAKSAGLKTCAIKDFPYNKKDWDLIVKEADMALDNIKDININDLK